MNFEKLLNAWRIAADDLGLNIQSPIVLTSTDNKATMFELLVKDFGNKKGTIVLSIADMSKHDIPKQNGFYCAAVNIESYVTYDRQHFIDTLNDWGYFGDSSKKPNWYTGQSWS